MVFATFAGNWEGDMAPRHISSSRAHSDKIPTATPKFSGSSFLMVISDFVGRQCVLEIQDGSRISGSNNNVAGFTDIHVVPKTIRVFMNTYETSKCPAVMADAISC